MDVELRALEQNNTWSIVSFSTCKKPLGYKWVHKTRFHLDGSMDRHKAHLVAKVYTQ